MSLIAAVILYNVLQIRFPYTTTLRAGYKFDYILSFYWHVFCSLLLLVHKLSFETCVRKMLLRLSSISRKICHTIEWQLHR